MPVKIKRTLLRSPYRAVAENSTIICFQYIYCTSRRTICQRLKQIFSLKTDFHRLADLKRRPRFRRIAKSRAVKLLIMRFCRYSRILVVIKSTPSEISFSASARSFTVQQLILIPRRLSSAAFSAFNAV